MIRAMLQLFLSLQVGSSPVMSHIPIPKDKAGLQVVIPGTESDRYGVAVMPLVEYRGSDGHWHGHGDLSGHKVAGTNKHRSAKR